MDGEVFAINQIFGNLDTQRISMLDLDTKISQLNLPAIAGPR